MCSWSYTVRRKKFYVRYLSSPDERLVYTNYSPEAKHSFGRIMEIRYGAKNGVHAFGCNSAEREPIWMKSGAL